MAETLIASRDVAEAPAGAASASFGTIWETEWTAGDRLVVRGYRARSALPILSRWDVDALVATVQDALEAADWSDIDRRAAYAAVRRLYAVDLTDGGESASG